MEHNILESACLIGGEIINHKHSFFLQCKKKQRINLYNNKFIYFLSSGSVSLHRLDNDLITLTIDAPSILGLNLMSDADDSHYIRCNKDSNVYFISMSEARELFNVKKLWKAAFEQLADHSAKYFKYESLILQKNNHDIIEGCIKSLWGMPESERHNISIYNYIMQRVQISRSSIRNSIKKMEDDGLIKVKRGKLVQFESLFHEFH